MTLYQPFSGFVFPKNRKGMIMKSSLTVTSVYLEQPTEITLLSIISVGRREHLRKLEIF